MTNLCGYEANSLRTNKLINPQFSIDAAYLATAVAKYVCALVFQQNFVISIV